MDSSSLVVIGASEGGVSALRYLMARLQADIPAAWCIAIHTGPHGSDLPSLLERPGGLRAGFAENGERIRPGRVYVAPPDHHFHIEDSSAILIRGPRENWARPAIDPLFRSAACAYGARAIGVILTGNLNDGTAGLLEVKQRGGVAVVQDPCDARCPGMATSALRHVEVDHCVPLADMPPLLMDLAARLAEKRERSGADAGGS